jgi:enoyl-CoA hydratase/carnithine racemase
MSAEEAKTYGLVDEVVKSRKDVSAETLSHKGENNSPARDLPSQLAKAADEK